ncbi:MAG: extracellular solute-binding protein [Firmicutes bacterium]|nr:extracellular solute-binding protein [Bacillota bacterium]
MRVPDVSYKQTRIFSIIIAILLVFILFTSCRSENKVVVYTSVDQNYAEQFFKYFEKETGIKVIPAFDTEASKTTGLVNRLIEESKNPRADVFWNGEFAQTLVLKSEGVLAPYKSEEAAAIPEYFKDEESYWTAFGGRARVLLVNTNVLSEEDMPRSIYSLLDEKYDPNRIGMAYPLFGTTATHAAAIYAAFGPTDANKFFKQIAKRKIRIVDGNSVVRDLVVEGVLAFGLTDTDDAIGAIEKGAPVKMVFPDQGEGEMGTLIVPNTVAIIKGGPNPKNAKVFIDFILKPESEKYLLEELGWIQTTVRPVGASNKYFNPDSVKSLKVKLEDIYQYMEQAKNELKELFIR